MNPVEVYSSDGPVVLGLPHTGTWLPDDVFRRLTPLGQTLADTDWHTHTLYDGLLEGATTVRATFRRYVIDANRDPSGESLYPGQNTTGLVSMTNFDGEPLWTKPPYESEIGERRRTYHAIYHKALKRELTRVRDRHDVTILYDCHSIRSHIPFLFKDALPDLNIGTNEGRTCAPEIEQAVANICTNAAAYTSIANGRFKGGWTTRHYGRPAENIHTIQMELAQSTHLKSEVLPFDYGPVKAKRLRLHLKSILESLADLAPKLRVKS